PPSPLPLRFLYSSGDPRDLPSFPTRRSSDLLEEATMAIDYSQRIPNNVDLAGDRRLQRALENWQPRFLDWWKDMGPDGTLNFDRSEEHTSELQSLTNLVCRLLLEKKKKHAQT